MKPTKLLQLGEVLRKWRLMSELPLRDAAGLMGISAPTLLRIEAGSSCDAETFMAIMGWLMTERPGKDK